MRQQHEDLEQPLIPDTPRDNGVPCSKEKSITSDSECDSAQATVPTRPQQCKIIIKRAAAQCSIFKLYCCFLPFTATLTGCLGYYFFLKNISSSTSHDPFEPIGVGLFIVLASTVMLPLACSLLLPYLTRRCCGIWTRQQNNYDPADEVNFDELSDSGTSDRTNLFEYENKRQSPLTENNGLFEQPDNTEEADGGNMETKTAPKQFQPLG